MKRILLAVSILGIFSAGCRKGYLDINSPNPNTSTVGTPELVLPNALNVTATRQITTYNFISGWMGQTAISGGYAPSNSDFTTYRITTSFGDGLWNSIYNNLEDYQFVINNALAQNNPFYAGTAYIMRSYEYQQLVDMFGDIPYTSALKGTEVVLPTYDDAQSIYTDLVTTIDSGISQLKTSTPGPATDAVMFGGDVTSWIKFANSLKLRILLRQTEVSGRTSYIQEQIAAIVSEGSGFLDIDANVNPGYLNTQGKQNPFFAFNVTPSGTSNNDRIVANAFAIDWYDVNDATASDYDPRGAQIYSPTATDPTLWYGETIGIQGKPRGQESFFGPGVVIDASQDATVMTAAESYFLQAEATARGLLTSGLTADSAYHAGIIASYEHFGLDASDAIAYYSDPANTRAYWGPGASLNTQLNLIIQQKWAAENTATPFETWADYRRLPNLPFNQSIPLSGSTNVDVLAIPYRLLYPVSEYSSNAANVEAKNQATTAHHTDKLFWMP